MHLFDLTRVVFIGFLLDIRGAVTHPGCKFSRRGVQIRTTRNLFQVTCLLINDLTLNLPLKLVYKISIIIFFLYFKMHPGII